MQQVIPSCRGYLLNQSSQCSDFHHLLDRLPPCMQDKTDLLLFNFLKSNCTYPFGFKPISTSFTLILFLEGEEMLLELELIDKQSFSFTDLPIFPLILYFHFSTFSAQHMWWMHVSNSNIVVLSTSAQLV